MTNGPFEVAKRAENTSGAFAVSFMGSSSFAESTFCAALAGGADFVSPLLLAVSAAVAPIAIKRVSVMPAAARFDTLIWSSLLVVLNVAGIFSHRSKVRLGSVIRARPQLHAGVLSKEHEDEVDRVRDAMGNNRHGEVAPGAQVHQTQQHAHEALVDDSRHSLICVGEAECEVDHDKADPPCRPGTIQQVGNPVHQVATVDHLFSEGRHRPYHHQTDERHHQVSMQRAKHLEVRLLPQPLHQQRLADEELEPFHEESGSNAKPQRRFPVSVELQPDTAPSDLSHSERYPPERQQIRRLAVHDEMPCI